MYSSLYQELGCQNPRSLWTRMGILKVIVSEESEESNRLVHNGCPINLWTITFDALNSWWMNRNDFFQCLNANSIQIEELWITNLIQNDNCNTDFYVWKKSVFFIFEKSIFYNRGKSAVASTKKRIQRK